MKKVLVATILTVALTGLAIVPSAKADSFVYDVTTIASNFSFNVIFDLPSFENPANDITTFVSSNFNGQPITNFGISGNSSVCEGQFPFAVGPGPCWILFVSNTVGGTSTKVSPSFSGPGTFTASDALTGVSTTVTITEVVGAPEPSSLALLPLGLVALLLVRKRTSHPSAA